MCYMTASETSSPRARAAKRPAPRHTPAARARGHAAPTPLQATAPAGATTSSLQRRPVTVGVRELRQNLSVYLDQVKQGVAMQVTEHGRVVAVLTPVPANASRYDILLAQGLITPATRSIRDLPPPRPLPPGARPSSEILDELREERL